MASGWRLVILVLGITFALGGPMAFKLVFGNIPGLNIITQYIETVTFTSIALGTLFAYYMHLPLSHTVYKEKARLIILRVTQLTQGLVLDIWMVIIIVLVIAWLIGFNNGIIGIWFIWCCVLWIYNLKEEDQLPEMESPTCSTNHQIPSISSTPTFQIPSGIDLKEFVMVLESRIRKLERNHEALASDKIQQSIALYTFDHQLSLRIQTLEEAFQQKEKLHQSQMETVFQTVHDSVNKKRNKVEIIQMYLFAIFNISICCNKFLLKSTLPKPAYKLIKANYKYEVNRWASIYKNLKEFEASIYKLIHRFQRK